MKVSIALLREALIYGALAFAGYKMTKDPYYLPVLMLFLRYSILGKK